MSAHLICYLARMQDAGLCSLWVSLGGIDDKRAMHVSPDRDTDRALAAQFPTRTFLLDGTDPKLQAIEDAEPPPQSIERAQAFARGLMRGFQAKRERA